MKEHIAKGHVNLSSIILVVAGHLLLNALTFGQPLTPDQLPPGSFWIEAEDFDYQGGFSISSASVMPYAGGAYKGKSSVVGIDYHVTGLGPPFEQVYRFALQPQVFFRDIPHIARPGGALSDQNYSISYPSPLHWFNYTRRIPSGLYRIYAAMAHPGSEPNAMRGKLGMVVNGAGTFRQEVHELGEFIGRGTGAATRIALVSLTDASGRPVAIRFHGNDVTLKFTMDSADLDGIGLAPVVEPEITAFPSSNWVVPSNIRFNLGVTCFENSVQPGSVEFWLDGKNITADCLLTGTSKEVKIFYRPPSLLSLGTHQYQLKFALAEIPPRPVVYEALFTVYAAQIQPDLLVRDFFEFDFIGDRIYSITGDGQTKTVELDRHERASYLVSLRNRGNALSEFTLFGTTASPGWEVRYFAKGQDVTKQMVDQSGYTPPGLLRHEVVDLRIDVTPVATLATASTQEIVVTAISTDEASKEDTVKIIARAGGVPDVPPGIQFSGATDLTGTATLGLVSSADGLQLQLSERFSTFPFIWVPNSNEATVSKVDTLTGQEVARYRTSPVVLASPSRTTVDLLGNCWVGNRATGTAVKIGLFETGGYVDRNGNGIIETSRDLNGDGDITGDEILPWGHDECVLLEIALVPGKEGPFIPGTPDVPYDPSPGTRGLAVDALGNVWLGTFGTAMFYYVHGDTGEILRKVDVSRHAHTSYGAVLDIHGVLWSSGFQRRDLLRFDPVQNSIEVITVGHLVYGLALDRYDHLFLTAYADATVTRLNILDSTIQWQVPGSSGGRGITVTEDGDVWTADSLANMVSRWRNDGVHKANISVGATPTGVAVDQDGKVWVVHLGDESIMRIDPSSNTIDLRKNIVGASHYGYSDMTGLMARNLSARIGNWFFVHDARYADAEWTTLNWQGNEPPGTSIRVKVRSSNDRIRWSAWETAQNATALQVTPPGKYLEVQVLLHSSSRTSSPSLKGLTIAAPNPPAQLKAGHISTKGDLHFRFFGASNRSYAIEVSSDLKQWRTLTTIAGTSKWQDLTDPLTDLERKRFYRAMLLP
jgi:streptogramin lyase